MSREIVFRAWDKRFNMHIFEFPAGYGLSLDGSIRVSNRKSDEFILEQYTGLDDADGVKIFEGDKCEFNGVEELGIVVWDEWCWGWNFDGEIQALCEFESSDIAVIGNIHDIHEEVE